MLTGQGRLDLSFSLMLSLELMLPSKSEFKVLSEISRDIGQVFFASVVVSPLVAGFDKENWHLCVGGFLYCLVKKASYERC